MQKIEEDQARFKRIKGKITSGNPKHKEKYQLDVIKMLKLFMIQDKKLLIYLTITQE